MGRSILRPYKGNVDGKGHVDGKRNVGGKGHVNGNDLSQTRADFHIFVGETG